MAVHLIDFHRFAVYEAGAVLISVLAYPGDSEENTRSSSRLALPPCAQSIMRNRAGLGALSTADQTNLRLAHFARGQPGPSHAAAPPA